MRISIGLLLFTKNERIEPSISKLYKFMEKIVVYDFESDPDVYQENKDVCNKYGCELYKIVDLGYIEVYRPLAFARFNTTFILNIDPDELPSTSFLNNLRNLPDADVIYVPRRAIGSRNVEYLPRIFKLGKITWRGYLHEIPIVEGTKVTLDDEFQITHMLDEINWDYEKNRREKFLKIECLIRPPVLHSFLNTYKKKRNGLISRIAMAIKPLSPISRPFLKSILTMYLMKELIFHKGRYRYSKFYRDYNLQKLDYFLSLPKEKQRLLIRLYYKVYEAGGPIKFLNLDDQNYMNFLSTSNIPKSGYELLEYLLLYKLQFGRSWNGDG